MFQIHAFTEGNLWKIVTRNAILFIKKSFECPTIKESQNAFKDMWLLKYRSNRNSIEQIAYLSGLWFEFSGNQIIERCSQMELFSPRCFHVLSKSTLCSVYNYHREQKIKVENHWKSLFFGNTFSHKTSYSLYLRSGSTTVPLADAKLC